MLVGIIVGLITASSIYVWNSENFTKEQKTILLLFVIFPPLQWVLIPVFLFYNKKQKESTTEYKAEELVNVSLGSLDELKQKGILTENEYKQKIEKIEDEKAEQNLKNSSEYKSLQQLFQAKVLTEDEFNGKVEVLKSKFIQLYDKQISSIKIENILGKWQNELSHVIFSQNGDFFYEESFSVNPIKGKWNLNTNEKTIKIILDKYDKNNPVLFFILYISNYKLTYRHNKTVFTFEKCKSSENSVLI